MDITFQEDGSVIRSGLWTAVRMSLVALLTLASGLRIALTTIGVRPFVIGTGSRTAPVAKLYKSKAWLELRRKQGKTIAEIAAECGVSYQMIDKQIKDFKLK